MPSDIDALAEGLAELRRQFWATHITGDQGLNDDYDPAFHAQALAATPPVADLLRLAAIGRAVMALPDDIPQNRAVEITRRHGTTVWEVYVWNGDDLDGCSILADLPSAIAAALEEET